MISTQVLEQTPHLSEAKISELEQQMDCPLRLKED